MKKLVGIMSILSLFAGSVMASEGNIDKELKKLGHLITQNTQAVQIESQARFENDVFLLGEINLNQTAIANLQQGMNKLDTKVDGVMASTHAINNARPFLAGKGETAIGAGVGFAGDESAVAVGAAHAFTNSLSMSTTFNVTTGSTSDVSGGAGIQYKF